MLKSPMGNCQILSNFANIGKNLMIFECFDLCKPISRMVECIVCISA